MEAMTFTSVWLLLLLVLGVENFQQDEFKVIFERVEIADYNPSFLSVAKTHNFKYNRTTTVANMTFQVLGDLFGKLDMEVQTYRFASNEYRLFPCRFSFDFCNYVTRNEFGLGELYKCGNLTGCPFKTGLYHVCNWSPNGTKFPPNIPSGNYMMDLRFIYRGVQTLFFQLYATIKYPEVKGYPFL